MLRCKDLLVLLTLGLLSACATNQSLKELRQLTPQGSAYSMALTRDYLRLSEEQAKAYDWKDSSYFAEKGLMAGYGQNVQPEMIENWNLPSDLKPEFIAAREKLVALSNEMLQAKKPQAAAAATLAFDAWLEKAEEDGNSAESAAQQQHFYKMLEALEFDALAAEEEKSAAQSGQSSSTAYLVYFAHGSTKVDKLATQVLEQAAKDITALNPKEVVINGHTDTTGDEEYNFTLSEKRAVSVLQTLITKGVPAAILKYFAFGESDPAVPTDDGVHEPRNRRAEIFLG